MSGSILTLCEPCSVLLQDGFRVTRIPHQITTEKKKIFQRCKKKYRDDILCQYTVTARSK